MKFFSWGANSHGQLGQGCVSEACCVPTVIDIPGLDPATISAVVGGGGHTLLLDRRGRVFAAGWNNRGQLGIADDDATTFRLVDGLETRQVVQLACGWDSSLAVTNDGALFVWGSNSYSQLGVPKQKFSWTKDPKLVPISQVKQASFGLRHMALVTTTGKVFVCGSGSKGQLGILNTAGLPFTELQCLTEVPGVQNVSEVVCGQHHTVALTQTGQVLVWGDNRFGQLGVDSTVQPVVYTPQQVPLFEGRPSHSSRPTPLSIFSGWTHTLVTTEGGKIINWGRNTYGQLGSDGGSRAVSWSPQVLSPIPIQHVKQVALGSEHNTALMDNGDILSWGWNEHGNCGTGTQENVWTPTPVIVPEAARAVLVGSGACHTFAVIDV